MGHIVILCPELRGKVESAKKCNMLKSCPIVKMEIEKVDSRCWMKIDVESVNSLRMRKNGEMDI